MIQVRFKPEQGIILSAILLKVTLQLISTANSGYHGDELLHMEAGKHLAFGYMDFPPFIGFISWIQNLFHSGSLFVNHLFNYISSIGVVIISGLITLRLGGRLTALAITGSAILFSPGFGASQYLFLPTAFEQFFWLLFIYYTVEFIRSNSYKYLLYIALVAAIGFLNKYSFVFLFAGFAVSILFFNRKVFTVTKTYLALLVFALLILPNLYWQFSNDYPIFHHLSELYKTQLNKQTFAHEFKTLVLFINPFSLFIWMSALVIVPFHPFYKTWRLPAFTLLFSFVLLMVSKGKSYYFFPVIISLLPFGAVFLENLLQGRRWIIYSYLFLLISFGSYTLPHGVPLLKLHKYISLYNLKPNKDNKIPLPFENYYADENRVKILKAVFNAFSSLTPEEKKRCLVWGRHYSMAGIVNLTGSDYDLPKAFSFHSSFYSWTPDFGNDVIVIAISESNLTSNYWETYFGKVEEAGVIENHYASEKNWYHYRVFVCRNIKYNPGQLKQLFRNQIF